MGQRATPWIVALCWLLPACDSDGGSGSTTQPPSPPDQVATCPEEGLYDPEVKKELTGANGTFVDECDGEGNLTEYTCVSEYVCSEGACWYEAGADVEPVTFPCGGQCRDGRCARYCPDEGATLVYSAVNDDGSIEVTDTGTDLSYFCEPASDCTMVPVEGNVVSGDVTMQGVHSLCTPGNPGLLNATLTDGHGGGDNCAWSCVVL